MIRILSEGEFQLIQTKGQTKILKINGQEFAWINASGIGEILVTSHSPHKIDHFLCVGKYRLYDVKNESDFTDLLHLELSVGNGKWQGYLLPTGLPIKEKKKSRIIPTHESITVATI